MKRECKRCLQLAAEVAQLKLLNEQLESRNRVLAAEVTSEILTAQDREGVVKGLTRKI